MRFASNKVILLKNLFNLKMQESNMITNHLNEFNTLINQLLSVGITLEDEIKAILLLWCSLPDNWEGVVMDVRNSVSSSSFRSGKKGSILNFDDVVGLLLSEDMRRENEGTSSRDVLVANNRGRT